MLRISIRENRQCGCLRIVARLVIAAQAVLPRAASAPHYSCSCRSIRDQFKHGLYDGRMACRAGHRTAAQAEYILGAFSGSGTSQSMQRNLRPPVLTSIKCIGLRHLEQVGGGGFFGMTRTLVQARALPNSLSPIIAEGGRVMAERYCDDYGFVCPVADLGVLNVTIS
jgi:hypothetical protein